MPSYSGRPLPKITTFHRYTPLKEQALRGLCYGKAQALLHGGSFVPVISHCARYMTRLCRDSPNKYKAAGNYLFKYKHFSFHSNYSESPIARLWFADMYNIPLACVDWLCEALDHNIPWGTIVGGPAQLIIDRILEVDGLG